MYNLLQNNLVGMEDKCLGINGVRFAMKLNGLPWKQKDHSVVFEIASKYCILDSFVDYDGYFISPKGSCPQ